MGLDPATLALKESSPGVKMRVALKDPRNGGINNAVVTDDSSASPMVGPDGDVYYGVLGNPFNGSRGWMLHFSGNLTQTKTPGAFGWDNTASVVPTSAGAVVHAARPPICIFTKYNNYAGLDGGDGVNRIAVLDPNDTMVEPHASSNGLLVMKEILTIAGPTPDPEFIAQFPNAVREWCINTAAVDPLTNSVMANSEDGKLYRWDLTTNTLSQVITLSPGIGEAYTPTVIGPDGTVYAINWAILNAVGRLSALTPTHTPTNTPTVTPTAQTQTPTETPTNTPPNTSTVTPTATPTATKTPTNTPATAQLLGSVTLQGRPAPPNARWSVPLRVSLTPQGGGPAVTCTPTTDQSGNFVCSGFLPGAYTACVKHSHTLQNCQSVTLVSGSNIVNFGTLREGDANDDNCVLLVDFSILVSTFAKCTGDVGFDARADFDGSGCVVLVDFSLLATNFGQCGDTAPLPFTPTPTSAPGLAAPVALAREQMEPAVDVRGWHWWRQRP